MTRVTVLAADRPLGLLIVTEASSRALEVMAVTTDPAGWPVPELSVTVERGDLLDLPCPERLIGESDVVVLPFGSSETTTIDFRTDIELVTALGVVSEGSVSNTTRFVLAGRGPSKDETMPGSRLHPLEDGVARLAEHAAVQIFATYVQREWTYVCPSALISSSEAGRGSRCLCRAFCASPKGEARSFSRYVASIVDVIECGDDLWSADETAAVSTGRPLAVAASAGVGAAHRR